MSPIRAVVTDIEGTTTAIDFVTRELFPYARARLADWVTAHQQEPAVAEAIAAVQSLTGCTTLTEVITQLHDWSDRDQKITPLKTLQGLIWREGYRDGTLKGHLYEDAWRALVAWHEQGIRLYLYSSGSIAAQQLLFGYSCLGDLTPLLSGYFDTTLGGKRESNSYHKLADQIGLPAAELLFLSDSVEELDAAATAGLRSIELRRDGREGSPHHRSVTTFAEISLLLR